MAVEDISKMIYNYVDNLKMERLYNRLQRNVKLMMAPLDIFYMGFKANRNGTMNRINSFKSPNKKQKTMNH